MKQRLQFRRGLSYTFCAVPSFSAATEKEDEMSEEDRIFLSPEEALTAIRIDFDQYPPQPRLFLDLCPLILGPDVPVVEDSRHDCVWMPLPDDPRMNRMRKLSFRALGDHLCHTLERSRPPPDVLADLCARVFLTPACPIKGDPNRPDGIFIDTGMADFRCRQCGHCCRQLDYHNQLTGADYQLWETQGRTDILEWVGTVREGDRIISHAIWMTPGTRRFAPVCPWLTQVPGSKRWECRIHGVKPEICRQYPGTRKHAQLTGCPAFQKKTD